MKTIEQLYKPLDLSATRCYVAVFTITETGYTCLEHKLPSYIQKLKGIYVSLDEKHTPYGNVAGKVSLNFNNHVLKNFQHTLVSTDKLNDYTNSFSLDETIVANSYMDGYYQDISVGKTFPFQLRVYLHYQPVP